MIGSNDGADDGKALGTIEGGNNDGMLDGSIEREGVGDGAGDCRQDLHVIGHVSASSLGHVSPGLSSSLEHEFNFLLYVNSIVESTQVAQYLHLTGQCVFTSSSLQTFLIFPFFIYSQPKLVDLNLNVLSLQS